MASGRHHPGADGAITIAAAQPRMTAPATRCSVIPVSPNTPTLGVGLQDRQHDDPAAVEVGVQLAGAPARITRSVSAATSGAADPPPSLLSRYRVCRNR